jgi:dinuclear metal center YbgI/SA1388 family protein
MKILDFENIANKIAPLDIQEEWDNSGFQIISENSDITGILISLDITDEVIEEAVLKKSNLIVTHHPLMFNHINSIEVINGYGRLITKLIKNDISVYSLHTPFDKIKSGNNDYLAKLLGLVNMENVSDFVVKGELREELPVFSFIKVASEELEIPITSIRFIGDIKKGVKTVGVCTGSGGEFISDFDYDVFITGDIKYHQAMEAKIEGKNVIDLGHYGTEKFFINNFYEHLLNELDIAGEYIPLYEFVENMDPYEIITV